MSEQVTCGCLTGKACERWAVVERAGTLVWEYLEGYGEQKGYCRHCHAELSFAAGEPVATPMVPRAAQEATDDDGECHSEEWMCDCLVCQREGYRAGRVADLMAEGKSWKQADAIVRSGDDES